MSTSMTYYDWFAHVQLASTSSASDLLINGDCGRLNMNIVTSSSRLSYFQVEKLCNEVAYWIFSESRLSTCQGCRVIAVSLRWTTKWSRIVHNSSLFLGDVSIWCVHVGLWQQEIWPQMLEQYKTLRRYRLYGGDMEINLLWDMGSNMGSFDQMPRSKSRKWSQCCLISAIIEITSRYDTFKNSTRLQIYVHINWLKDPK